jgi:hypothetical protein
MRFRTTAPPIFLVTVKPNRASPEEPSARGFVSRTKEGVAKRAPPLSLRNSARFLSVVSATTPPPASRAAPRGLPLGRQALAALGATARDDLDATCRLHTGAEAVAALANELARLIGPFHGEKLQSKSNANTPGDDEMRHPGLIVMGWWAYKLRKVRSQQSLKSNDMAASCRARACARRQRCPHNLDTPG